VLSFIAALAALPSVPATSGGNDANLGVDAGDTLSAASLLPALGIYQAEMALNDVDWFRVGATSTAPQCVTFSVTGSAGLTLDLESTGVTRRATSASSPTGQALASIAVPGNVTARLGVQPLQAAPSGYAFSIGSSGLPVPSAADAFSGHDAGATLSGALPVQAGCTGGRLGPVNNVTDLADAFSFSLGAGEQLTYSFAHAGAAALELRVLNAAGVAVAPSLSSGGVGTFVADGAGTYFITVAAPANSALGDTPYLVGLTIGPPDPGSGCRPQC
jgi:hypothetical protein